MDGRQEEVKMNDNDLIVLERQSCYNLIDSEYRGYYKFVDKDFFD